MSPAARHSEPGLGTLELQSRSPDVAAAALDWAREHLRSRPRLSQTFVVAGERAWGKAEPFPPSAARRHFLRRQLLRRPLPRFAEYSNLAWLGRHCFEAAVPLAAGVLLRSGVPRWQFLLTREVSAAVSLDRWLDDGAPDQQAVLEELCDEVARLHSLGFIHRDLFPRNLLIRHDPAARRVVFLDAWRGGPRWQLRGAAYDLAGLLLHLSRWLDPDSERAWLERYATQREAQGRPVVLAELAHRVAAERLAFAARYRRRGRASELSGLRER